MRSADLRLAFALGRDFREQRDVALADSAISLSYCLSWAASCATEGSRRLLASDRTGGAAVGGAAAARPAVRGRRRSGGSPSAGAGGGGVGTGTAGRGRWGRRLASRWATRAAAARRDRAGIFEHRSDVGRQRADEFGRKVCERGELALSARGRRRRARQSPHVRRGS